MRRLALIALLALAGCGEDEIVAGPGATIGPALTTPGTAPLPLGDPVRVRESDVPAGETGVLSLDGRAAARPRRLAIADDAELSDVTWDEWGADGAEGRGELRVIECVPNCAQGSPKTVTATIRLSAPRACPDGRYFDRAVVAIDGRDPTSFIQAPC
jgi:hypothetical protein